MGGWRDFGVLQEDIKTEFEKHLIFVFWDGDLRMARMAPSRQGDMDGPQDKLRVLRKIQFYRGKVQKT